MGNVAGIADGVAGGWASLTQFRGRDMASLINGGFPTGWAVGPRRAAVELLLEAEGFARDTACDIWDFAVEFPTLRTAGLTETDLRWLLKKEFLLHRLETTPVCESTRCFLGNGGLKFAPESCFVLTGAGETMLRLLLRPEAVSYLSGGGHDHHEPGRNGTAVHVNGHGISSPSPLSAERQTAERAALAARNGTGFHPLQSWSDAAADDTGTSGSTLRTYHGSSPAEETTVQAFSLTGTRGSLERIPPPVGRESRPQWDDSRKELWFDGVLVKKFRFRSPNQEMVLMGFEEEGWPAKLDDPLPPVPNQTSKQRLHDAIKNLNRHHLHRVLRFAGDGTGEGVRWERVSG